MSNTPSAFGTPSYAGNKTFTKYLGPSADKVLRGRIIPPIKELAASGEWRRYHACHFGYKVTTSGGTERFELFACPLVFDNKTKIVKVPCDECAKNERIKQEIKELDAIYTAQKKSPEDIKELLAPKVGYTKLHNRDGKHYINFELEDGEVIVLLLSNTTFKDLLDPLLTKITEKYGFDPLLAGVVFEISATGKQLNKVDKIDYVTILEEYKDDSGKVRKSETIKCVEWTEAAAANAAAKGIDLRNPDRFIRLSQDQIKMLTNCSGDPEEVAGIVGLGQRVTKERSPVVPIVNTKPKVETSPAPKEVTAAQVSVAPFVEDDDEEAVLARQLAAIRANKAAKSAKVVVPTVIPDNIEEMSDEQFMATIKG